MIARPSYYTSNLYDIKLTMSTLDNVPQEAEIVDSISRGCVLVSQPEEFSHFFVKAVILIFDHGKDETQGVILERPSAFTVCDL